MGVRRSELVRLLDDGLGVYAKADADPSDRRPYVLPKLRAVLDSYVQDVETTKLQVQVPASWGQHVRELADAWGVHYADVLRVFIKTALGATTPGPKERGIDMARAKVNMDELAPLLETTDNVTLATRFGVTPERIRQLRRIASGATPRKLASPRRRKYAAVTDTPEFQAALGTVPDYEIAARFGVPAHTVVQARKVAGKGAGSEHRRAQVIPLLGTVPDQELADRFGYSLSGIVALRRRNNIEAYAAAGEVPKRRTRRTKAQMAAARALGLEKAAKPRIAGTVPPGRDVDVSVRSTTASVLDATTLARLKAQAPLQGDVDDNTFARGLVDFVKTRHATGDSVEALAARLDVTQDVVTKLLATA